jgi:hypothetical protein
MQFTATADQMYQIVANAITHSKAVGMGVYHFQRRNYLPEDIKNTSIVKEDTVSVDYYAGRMVKISFRRVKDNTWDVLGDEAHPEYQSWCCRYETYRDLILSVPGVSIGSDGLEQNAGL